MKNPIRLPILFSLLLTLPVLAGKPQQLNSPDQVPEGLAKSDWQSIHGAHEAWLHQILAVDGNWQASNPGQQWTTRFDRRGFLTTPKDANWTWGLALQSYGFGQRQTRIDGTPVVRTEGRRLTYRWSDGLEEWFINDSRGLEHGFTLAERPEASQPNEELGFTLTTRGPLMPKLAEDGQAVYFHDASGVSMLTYAGLKVWDADGTILPSRFEVAGHQVRLLVNEANARYPLTIDPLAQQAYLKAGNNAATTSSDYFGHSVAISGNTVVIGAHEQDASGAAYVFVRNAGIWSQEAFLKPPAVGTTQAGDRFGYSVAISGNTIVVGAPFEDSSTTAAQVGAGTPNENSPNSGAAYVFIRNVGVWTQQAYLKPAAVGTTQSGDGFGTSVSVSVDTVVVGASGEDSSTTGVQAGAGTPNDTAISSGAAYVFIRNTGTWTQQAYLKPAAVGTTQNLDFFGTSVSVSGDTVVVGAVGEDSSSIGVNSVPNEDSSGSGAAYIFMRASGTWTQQAYLKSGVVGSTQRGDEFGCSVAVSGAWVVVGAQEEDSGSTGVNSAANESVDNSGAAYVFLRLGSWLYNGYLKPSNPDFDNFFGCSVAISGTQTIVVGARNERSSTKGVNSSPNRVALHAGAAYVFVPNILTWRQNAYLKACNTNAFDYFGCSVAVDVDTVIVGAEGEDSSSSTINSMPEDNGAESAGASYIFIPTTQEMYTNFVAAAGLTGNNALPDATPFHDGVPNLVKYAFGMNAAGNDHRYLVPGTGTVGLPTFELIRTPSLLFRYEFIRRIQCGVSYKAVQSSTLLPGSWVPVTGTITVTPINTNWERVVVEQPVTPNTLPKRFFRMELRND